MIDNIFEFDETIVREIMTPRPDIIAIDINDSKEKILKIIKRSKYTRLPVYNDKVDNIEGIFFIKDLLMHLDKILTKDHIQKAVRKPFIVPETKQVDELLTEFRKTKNHMAIVVDEFGAVAGLITIEDLLEEIVGEIYDEKDKISVQVKKKSDSVSIVDASIEVAEANEQLGLGLNEDEDYTTLGGFVLEKLGHIPKVGEKVDLAHAKVVVEGVENNRILQLRITKKAKKK